MKTILYIWHDLALVKLDDSGNRQVITIAIKGTENFICIFSSGFYLISGILIPETYSDSNMETLLDLWPALAFGRLDNSRNSQVFTLAIQGANNVISILSDRSYVRVVLEINNFNTSSIC